MPPEVPHVWCQSGYTIHPPDPGLLIAWEQHGGVRWAWVMVGIDRPGHSTAVIQRWMFRERDLVVAPSRPISPDRNRGHLGWFDDDQKAGVVGMAGDQVVTVRARVRARTRHDEPPAEERWEQARGAYQGAREEILGRVAEDEFVVAWYVDRD